MRDVAKVAISVYYGKVCDPDSLRHLGGVRMVTFADYFTCRCQYTGLYHGESVRGSVSQVRPIISDLAPHNRSRLYATALWYASQYVVSSTLLPIYPLTPPSYSFGLCSIVTRGP